MTKKAKIFDENELTQMVDYIKGNIDNHIKIDTYECDRRYIGESTSTVTVEFRITTLEEER